MENLNIIAYLKPTCGWSQGVRAVLRKYNLPFEDRDIVNDPAQREEMIRKSSQTLSPCVEIAGVLLADVSGDEVETYLREKELVQPVQADVDVPTNAGCADGRVSRRWRGRPAYSGPRWPTIGRPCCAISS